MPLVAVQVLNSLPVPKGIPFSHLSPRHARFSATKNLLVVNFWWT